MVFLTSTAALPVPAVNIININTIIMRSWTSSSASHEVEHHHQHHHQHHQPHQYYHHLDIIFIRTSTSTSTSMVELSTSPAVILGVHWFWWVRNNTSEYETPTPPKYNRALQQKKKKKRHQQETHLRDVLRHYTCVLWLDWSDPHTLHRVIMHCTHLTPPSLWHSPVSYSPHQVTTALTHTTLSPFTFVHFTSHTFVF